METNVTFSNSSFSLRCGKCADIHNAQLEGRTNKSCECDCHNKPTYIPNYPLTNPIYPDPCCPTIPSPIWCGIPTVTCNTDMKYYEDFNTFATRNLKANTHDM